MPIAPACRVGAAKWPSTLSRRRANARPTEALRAGQAHTSAWAGAFAPGAELWVGDAGAHRPPDRYRQRGLVNNPSRRIAIIQTSCEWRMAKTLPCFNPSRGIAIIQTAEPEAAGNRNCPFQSLTRDSNHSNKAELLQDFRLEMFQSLTRDSNHSNAVVLPPSKLLRRVSIPHAG